MKKVLLSTIAVLMFIGVTVAQQGPKAKNYKPWNNDNKEEGTISTVITTPVLAGPMAKNYKQWDIMDNEVFVSVNEVRESIPSLQGPKAKNFKYWNANGTVENTSNLMVNKATGPMVKNRTVIKLC